MRRNGGDTITYHLSLSITACYFFDKIYFISPCILFLRFTSLFRPFMVIKIVNIAQSKCILKRNNCIWKTSSSTISSYFSILLYSNHKEPLIIKALILDYGNVISLTDTKAIDATLAAETGIPVEAFENLYSTHRSDRKDEYVRIFLDFLHFITYT